MKLLIIPDIHGRRFWKHDIDEHLDEVDHVIFLGDYLDHYTYEKDPFKEEGNELILCKDELPNLEDIIELKKKYPEKITLLLGNHDMHYKSLTFYEISGSSRFNKSLCRQFEKAFNDNSSLFQYAYQLTYFNKNRKSVVLGDENNRESIVYGKTKLHSILFTHAGLSEELYLNISNYDEDFKKMPEKERIYSLADHLNKIDEDNILFRSLINVGITRGGYGGSGGIFWADLTDILHSEFNENTWLDWQVFGHTQLKKDPIVIDNKNNHSICLDARRSFIFNTVSGKFFEMNGNAINPTILK